MKHVFEQMRQLPDRAQLEESRKLLTSLFESAGDYFLVFEPGTTGVPLIFEASHSAFPAHGYTAEELIGKPISLLDPFTTAEMYATTRENLAAHGHATFEKRHIRKDGSTFDVEARAILVQIGRKQLVFSVERDISERKRAEARLQHSHALMSYVIEHARSAIAVHDRDLNYVYVSERYLREYSVKERDVIGRHHYDVFPDLPQKWRDVHQRALRGEVLSAEEDSYERADGSVEWTRWECRPWYESDGSIGGIIVYTEVITDRIRAARKLIDSESDLRRSQAIAHVGHWVWNIAADTLEWSDEMKRIFGVAETPRPHEHQAVALRAVHPEDRNRVQESISAQMAGTGIATVEYRVLRPDGTVRTVVAVPGDRVTDSTGRVVRLTGVVQDISDLARSEEQRKTLEGQLQQAMKMEAVGRLAGGIAHDFNNLLTGISGNIELALLELPSADPVVPLLRSAEKAAASAAALTQQLLAFSRKQIIQPKIVSFNDLLTDIENMLTRLIGEDIRLKTLKAKNLGPVNVDRGQFEQVLVNLVVNARDAMPDGGELLIETANVRLDADYCKQHSQAQPGRYVMLAVSDTGEGMSDEVKKHIFEPFFTTKAKGHGTGLGLATIFGTVNQSGGFIEWHSEVGRGTCFKIYLPRAEGAVQPRSEPAPAREIRSGHETVLLVEDEEVVRNLARTILIRAGYQVLSATDGAEALNIAAGHKHSIHLLLTDVVMPGMNGRELGERLSELHPETRVLFCSGYTEDFVVHRGVVEANVNFIHKPYSPGSLTQRVREVLDAPAPQTVAAVR